MPLTSAASRIVSPSTSLTSVPGSSRSSLTKVPLVEFSSLIVACPASSTTTSACRRDTFSHCSKAAPTSDSAGSLPSSTDVPAGTSTFPAGKLILSTADEIRPPEFAPATAFCETVIGTGGSVEDLAMGRLAPHVKQMRSSGPTSAEQSGQVLVTISSVLLQPFGRAECHGRHPAPSLALVRRAPGSIAA